uniref:helix-turn-helix domain-containing protein n=1 Tax=Flavobacterium sp. TaxID=239 RepID=UPI004049614F
MKQTLQHKLKFNDGIAIYIGNGITTNLHKHYALEIVFSYENSFQIITKEKTYEKCKFVIIPKNIEHQFIGSPNDFQVFIYIDPFHQLANFLVEKFELSSHIIANFSTFDKISLPTHKQLLAINNNNLLETIRKLVEQLTNKKHFISKSDPRIAKSFEHIYKNLNKKISIKDISSSIYLSESRYAHLFKQEVGIPFRRYVLWLRLQRTIQSIMEGNSLTTACYDGGFTDLPHFNKVFQDMFGITPSAVLKG